MGHRMKAMKAIVGEPPLMQELFNMIPIHQQCFAVLPLGF
jgi:hypothetical protein